MSDTDILGVITRNEDGDFEIAVAPPARVTAYALLQLQAQGKLAATLTRPSPRTHGLDPLDLWQQESTEQNIQDAVSASTEFQRYVANSFVECIGRGDGSKPVLNDLELEALAAWFNDCQIRLGQEENLAKFEAREHIEDVRALAYTCAAILMEVSCE